MTNYYDTATGNLVDRLSSTGNIPNVTIVNPSGAILGSGAWEVVDDQTLAAAALAFDFTSLDGSAAYMYKLTGRLIGDNGGGGGGAAPAIQLNADTGNNYKHLVSTLYTTYTGAAATAQPQFAMTNNLLATNDTGIFEVIIYAGTARYHVIKSELFVADTAATAGKIWLATGHWDGTTSVEITSIKLTGGVAGLARFGIGSRVQLSRLALA